MSEERTIRRLCILPLLIWVILVGSVVSAQQSTIWLSVVNTEAPPSPLEGIAFSVMGSGAVFPATIRDGTTQSDVPGVESGDSVKLTIVPRVSATGTGSR